MKHNDVVILIPSYEPDEQLINVVHKLLELEFPILIVNDGSKEEYNVIFDKVNKDVEYISYPTNHGKGYALKVGYKNIPTLFPDAKYIITADGDGQHSIKDIEKMYEILKSADELVLGVRLFDKSVPFRSRFGNEWTKVNRCLLTKQYLEDDQCGLRGFPIRYLTELIKIKGNRYEYEINQLTAFQLRDYKIIRMPIEVIYIDNNSKSHFNNFPDTVRIHSKIIIQGIPALLCLGLLIAGLILLYHFGYSYYHLMVLPAYLVTTLIYVGVLDIIQKSQKPLNRLLRELIFTITKMTFVFACMYLFVDAFRMSFYVAIPLLVIVSCFYNLLLPRVIKLN